MIDQLTQDLEQLGLVGYEARIYAALLEDSPASATHIAKKCRLSRSSVYTTLSALIAKGLVSTTYKNTVKQFIAEDASALDQLLRKEQETLHAKMRAFDSLKVQLARLQPTSRHIPQVIFFEGQIGLKKVYLSMLREARPDAALYLLRDEFVWQPEWQFIFESEWHARVKRYKIEKNIRTKLLINPSQTEQEHAKIYRAKHGLEARSLPPVCAVKQFALYILGDVIAILSLEKNNLLGIQIVNAHLAQNVIRLFENIWSQAGRLATSRRG